MKFIDDELLEKILYGILVILLIVIIGILLFKDFDKEESIKNSNSDVVAINDEVKEEEVVETNEVKKIKVDVKGAVKKEGVYELEYGSRVNDAIKAAGGLKSNASTKYLNLSKKINDETVIKVYTDNQIKNMSITYEVKEACECPTQEIIDCAGASIIEDSTNNNEVSDSADIKDTNDQEEVSEENIDNTIIDESTNKVSINSGTKDELMTLKGIGSAKADAIIEYRTKNNGFKTLEDIMNVSGIGEAAFNKIKDSIKL